MFYDMISENSWRLHLSDPEIISLLFPIFTDYYPTFKSIYAYTYILQKKLWTMLGIVVGVAMK